MKFGESVIRFDFAGIPMVGNLDTGYAIGLTDDGAQICDALLTEETEEEKISAVDQALLEHLTKGGFFKATRESPSLSLAYLHVTQRCNLNCVGCYSSNEQRNTLTDAPLASFKQAIAELAHAGVESLVVSGGEPFLRSDLAEMMQFAKQECGIKKISVLSNGTLIGAADLTKFVDSVDEISISFDGCSSESIAYIREEQRFAQLVDAVKTIQAAGIPAHIIATIHAKNYEDMAAYSALSKELGVTLNFSLLSCSADSSSLGKLFPNDEILQCLGRDLFDLGTKGAIAVSDAPIASSITVKRICGAGTQMLSIAADGTVYPCHMLHAREWAMGNAFTDSFSKLLQGNVAALFENLSVDKLDGCKECDYAWVCGGGCRGRSYAAFGNIQSKDSYCAMVTEFYASLGRRIKELYA